jgi:hypothetical protein
MPEVHVFIEIDDFERGLALARPEPTFETGEHVLATDFTRHRTPIHLDFVVDDLDAAVARAVHAGAVLERRVDHPGLWRLAALADPFGNGFDLIERPEAGYATLAERMGDL